MRTSLASSNPPYEILAVTHAFRRIAGCFVLGHGRTAAAQSPARGEIPGARTAPSAPRPTTVQPEYGPFARKCTSTGGFAGQRLHAVNQSSQGRLSVRNSRPWKAARGRESFLAWKVYRCRRVSARHRSEGSLHAEDLSRSLKSPDGLPTRATDDVARGLTLLDKRALCPMLTFTEFERA
jgi:hypothetical protein